jgi:hypothetical protein
MDLGVLNSFLPVAKVKNAYIRYYSTVSKMAAMISRD